jgi:hypothetical protein
MTDVALKIYPRGFLGRPLEPQVKLKAKPFEARLNALAVRVNVFTPQVNSVDANPMVESLYGKWINRAPETVGFDFKEKVLIAALGAFGTENFLDWYASQLYSPVFGDMHRRFLLDTLYFLINGRRNMSIENWTALVSVNDSGEKLEEFNPQEREFFGIKDPDAQYRQPQNRSLYEIIQLWVSHPSGFDDLVSTLHLLFGDLS